MEIAAKNLSRSWPVFLWVNAEGLYPGLVWRCLLEEHVKEHILYHAWWMSAIFRRFLLPNRTLLTRKLDGIAVRFSKIMSDIEAGKKAAAEAAVNESIPSTQVSIRSASASFFDHGHEMRWLDHDDDRIRFLFAWSWTLYSLLLRFSPFFSPVSDYDVQWSLFFEFDPWLKFDLIWYIWLGPISMSSQWSRPTVE